MLNWVDHSEIEQRLRGEVDAARAEYEAIGWRTDLPEGETPEDAKRRVLESYLRALMRFAGFTLSGTVPEDLRPLN